VRQGASRSFKVLQGDSTCFRELQGASGCFREIQGVSGCFRVLLLQGASASGCFCFRVLQGTSGYYWVFQVGAFGCFRVTWVPLGAFGCLWVPLGAFGCLWVPLGAFESLGCLWMPFDALALGAFGHLGAFVYLGISLLACNFFKIYWVFKIVLSDSANGKISTVVVIKHVDCSTMAICEADVVLTEPLDQTSDYILSLSVQDTAGETTVVESHLQASPALGPFIG
jgi:hypothetical protein